MAAVRYSTRSIGPSLSTSTDRITASNSDTIQEANVGVGAVRLWAVNGGDRIGGRPPALDGIAEDAAKQVQAVDDRLPRKPGLAWAATNAATCSESIRSSGRSP